MRRHLILLLVSAFSLQACIVTPIPKETGYKVSGNTVRWVGVVPGSVFALDVIRMRVRDADAATFKILNADYAVDARNIYYRGRALEDGDPATFKLLPDRYAASSRHVYQDGKELSGADPRSWRRLENGFSTDGVYVYSGGARLEGADPKTFRVNGNSEWPYSARDDQTFFRGNSKLGTIADCVKPAWDGAYYWGPNKEELHYLCNELGASSAVESTD